MEYTKGEWSKGSFADEPFARSLLSIYREDGEAIVMVLSPNLMAFEEAEANAQLIAAAPDLYEACKAVLPLLTGAFYITHTTRPEIVALKQAIAKAEG
jgi:hypothetical protein